ncbi:MAG: 3-dehydroquinate synthase [Gammaproteobacteria bacterium]|nr:3-dehydroquinate synthase [Gammaproteobacteria bacterium]MDH3858518.1 3-dehydroquinate synthase [Gammaproteobacteria bacterium]
MHINHRLEVDLGDRGYPIYIGTDLLGEAEIFEQHIHGRSALIVSNSTVAPLYIDAVQQALDGAGIRRDEIILEDGEQYKTMAAVESTIDLLLTRRHDRRTTLIALGGGVIGDIAGFAASIYQRGVNFIQIPTTLLSQVDSSVGGKTGVNHPLGKNMIGAFFQPQCVIADINTLKTLPARELSAGLAEVIKYGLICDADFFNWLESNMAGLLKLDQELLAQAVMVSCQDKARVVEQDEREAGLRAILNLGHSFGHAIETVKGYGIWLHGEAVAAGMVMAIDLSIREGWIDEDVRQRTIALLQQAGLPVTPPDDISIEQYLETMSIDKKAVDGKINLVLLKAIGDAFVTADYNHDKLVQTLGP